MEFKFSINSLFGESVTIVDHRLEPHGSTGENLRAHMEQVIDEMGQASAKAQGLHGPITSAHKLRFSNHHLYVMKDTPANGGLGAAVGILKVGRKKLFVLDAHGKQTEMEPLCVLDFYVHESCQRRGCGKTLFQAMLTHEGLQAQHLPIDRPSHKFTSFLAKHYNLRATIHQVNNFVIFDGFFRGQPEDSYVKRRSAAAHRKPPPAPNKRDISHSGYRNTSSAALWSDGSMSARRNSLDNPTTARMMETKKESVPGLGRSGSAGSISSQAGSGSPLLPGHTQEPSNRAFGAQASSYSRHNRLTGTPPSPNRMANRMRSTSDAANSAYMPNGSPFGSASSGGRGQPREATPPFGRPTALGQAPPLASPVRNGQSKMSPIATSAVPGGNLGQSPVLPGIGATSQQASLEKNPSGGYGYSPGSLTKEGNYCLTPQAKTMHSSWNVMGIPPSYPQRSPQGGSNRPW